MTLTSTLTAEAKTQKAPSSLKRISRSFTNFQPTASKPTEGTCGGQSKDKTKEDSKAANKTSEHTNSKSTYRSTNSPAQQTLYSPAPSQQRRSAPKRRLIQSVKTRLRLLCKMLGIGTNVRSSQLPFLTALTYCCVVAKEQKLDKDHKLDKMTATRADTSSEPNPEEAGHPQAFNTDSREQRQQSISRDGQSMAVNNHTDSQDYGQTAAAKSDSFPTTPQGPLNSVSDATNSKDHQNPIGELISAQRKQRPGQYLPNDAGPVAYPIRVVSSSTQVGHPKWKSTFPIVIHLANDGNGTRVACLDTGADVDVVSIQVVDSLGLRKEDYKGSPLKPIGHPYHPQWQVTFDWHVAKFKKTYTSTFAVLDEEHSAGFDVLLGRRTVEACEFFRVNPAVFFQRVEYETVLPNANGTAANGSTIVQVKEQEPEHKDGN
ncbi:MAG: hypothetical protein Q9224_002846 [Gallowayella concinna]